MSEDGETVQKQEIPADCAEDDIMPSSNKKESVLRRVLKALGTIKVMQFVAILIAVVAFIFDMGWKFVVERPELQREREVSAIEREEASFAREMQAWERLSEKDFGLGGYGEAIQYILHKNKLIHGLDMSCEAFGGVYSPSTDDSVIGTSACSPNLNFDYWNINGEEFGINNSVNDAYEGAFKVFHLNVSGADFEALNFTNSILVSSKFEDTRIKRSRLDNLEVVLGEMSGSYLSDSLLTNSRFTGTDMSNVDFFYLNLSNSFFEVDFSGAHFHHVNLSGVDLRTSVNLEKDAFVREAWAWAENPPLISEGIIPPRLCNDNLRKEYVERTLDNFDPGVNVFIIPQGCHNWQWADWPVKNLPKVVDVISCSPALREAYYATPVDQRPSIPEGCSAE